MGFDLFDDTLSLLGRSRESSSVEECAELTKLVARDDFDKVVLASLQRTRR